MRKKEDQAALIRKELSDIYRQIGRLLRRMQRLRSMTPGSLYLLRRRCGKAGCRCARGQLHSSWVVTRSEKGRIRLYTVKDEERAQVRQWTGEYRVYQRGRACLAKLSAGLLAGIDGLAGTHEEVWPARAGRLSAVSSQACADGAAKNRRRKRL